MSRDFYLSYLCSLFLFLRCLVHCAIFCRIHGLFVCFRFHNFRSFDRVIFDSSRIVIVLSLCYASHICFVFIPFVYCFRFYPCHMYSNRQCILLYLVPSNPYCWVARLVRTIVLMICTGLQRSFQIGCLYSHPDDRLDTRQSLMLMDVCGSEYRIRS